MARINKMTKYDVRAYFFSIMSFLLIHPNKRSYPYKHLSLICLDFVSQLLPCRIFSYVTLFLNFQPFWFGFTMDLEANSIDHDQMIS